MKRFIISICMACATILAGTSSCKKSELNPSNMRLSPDGNAYPAPLIVVRTTSDWVNDVTGFPTCTFKNVVPYGSRSVKVYLLTGGKEEQINQFIFFMGGQLWATWTGTDVKIVFSCSCDKPAFEPLHIKIVRE
jgi:hypothetical protein